MSLPFYLEEPRSSWYDELAWVGLDLETTNLDKGDPRNPKNRVVMAAAKYWPSGSGLISDESLGHFGTSPMVLVAHNAKFELGWLWRYEANVQNILPWDTMIAEYVLAGNRQWDLSLDATARRYGLPGKESVVDALITGGVCPSEIPRKWLEERVRYDVETAVAVARRQQDILDERGLLNVFFTRCIATPVLARIEQAGMRLDMARVTKELDTQRMKRDGWALVLSRLTGGINLRSRPQLGAFLYDTLGFEEPKNRDGTPDRTRGGGRRTDAATLGKLKAKTPEQKEFLSAQAQFADADARLTKALDVFAAAPDATLYANFNQTVTQTHRLSCTAKKVVLPDGTERGVQLQNLPRDYKRLFMAQGTRNVITEFDYSQLEFRAAVELAGDTQGMADIQSGHDVHRFTASVLRRKPMDQVTDDERQAAKPDTFKPLYYGKSGTDRQKAYYAAFRERYPEISAMQERWIADAVRTHEQVTASGLIYYWPDARRDRSGYVPGSPSICNYPIQAFATADIVPVGLAYLFWQLPPGATIINTVHDSIVVDHAIGTDLTALARKAMIEDVEGYIFEVYGRELKVPLAGEYLTAPHWGDKAGKISSGSF